MLTRFGHTGMALSEAGVAGGGGRLSTVPEPCDVDGWIKDGWGAVGGCWAGGGDVGCDGEGAMADGERA